MERSIPLQNAIPNRYTTEPTLSRRDRLYTINKSRKNRPTLDRFKAYPSTALPRNHQPFQHNRLLTNDETTKAQVHITVGNDGNSALWYALWLRPNSRAWR